MALKKSYSYLSINSSTEIDNASNVYLNAYMIYEQG